MKRVYNFSAGPAVMPESVLKKAAEEMMDYRGCGMSVMELSHRGKEFLEIMGSAEALLRDILSIPDNYRVLFLQGGASLQFAMVPMNLMHRYRRAHYVHTGQWTKKAIKEARLFGEVHVAASSEDTNFDRIPELDLSRLDTNADYFYIATNNTIYGTSYRHIPNTGSMPLVADMSSNILSEPIDVSQFGLIFAGAQKNIGPAGLTIVIIRDDLLKDVPHIPTLMRYKDQVENGSMINTPPCYAIYMAKLVFEWIQEQGGLAGMKERNEAKAALLYAALDQSQLFRSPVHKMSRSLMNVPFVTGDEAMDKKFIAESSARGLKTLKGHRSVGGMRASIYNAMPIEGVQALVNFMREFEETVTGKYK